MRLPTLLLALAASADQFDLRKLQIHRDGDRLRYSYGDKDVSPWHDVPFWADADQTLVHFVCEIPRLTRSKLEIHKSVAGNKLVQDTKGPHPRFYKYSAAVVNYGAISQTWEDPAVADEHTGVGVRAHGRRRSSTWAHAFEPAVALVPVSAAARGGRRLLVRCLVLCLYWLASSLKCCSSARK